MKLEVFVAGRPISQNAMYGMARSGRSKHRLYLTTEARQWQSSVKFQVVQKVVAIRKLQQPLTISYRFTGVKGDADNYLKTTNDGLKRALNVDDRHFKIGSAVVESDGQPGVWLTIADAAESAGAA